MAAWASPDDMVTNLSQMHSKRQSDAVGHAGAVDGTAYDNQPRSMAGCSKQMVQCYVGMLLCRSAADTCEPRHPIHELQSTVAAAGAPTQSHEGGQSLGQWAQMHPPPGA